MAENVALLTDQEEISLCESDIRIILVGKTGAGKSTTGNTILERVGFVTEASPKPITLESKRADVLVNKKIISVIDTPGFCTSQNEEDMEREIQKCVELSVPGPHAFLMVIRLGRFTTEEKNAVEFIKKHFGEDASVYTIVLFTHADQLENKLLETYVGESHELLNLIDSCGGRYHSFNNKAMENRSQVTQLLEKIDEMVEKNGGHHYTNVMFQKAQKKVKKEKMIKKAEEIALGVGSVMGTGAVVAGGVVMGITDAVALPAVAVGAGAVIAVGAAVKLTTNKIRSKKEAKKNKVKH